MGTTTMGSQEEKRKLPAGWRWVRLGEICERIDYGYTATATPDIEYPKFLRITDIQDGNVDWMTVPGCDIPETQESEYRLRDGDIVFARTGATTGKSFLLKATPRSVFASYLIRLRAIPQVIISDFLAMFFRSNGYWEQVAAGVRGGAQGGFNASMLKKLSIPLPSLDEQQRITSSLTAQMATVEKARTAAQDRLEAIKALPTAFLRQVFPQPGQPLPAGWRWVRLSKVVDVRDGTHGTPLYISEGIPLVTSKNLKPTGIDFREVFYISKEDYMQIKIRSGVDKGDILFAMIGTIGNPVIVETDREFSIKNVALFKFVNSPIYNEYFYYLLQSESISLQLSAVVQGGIQKFVSLSVLRNLNIPFPQMIEQQRIVVVLKAQMAAVEKARAAAEVELAAINALPAALLRRAFTGEL